MGSWSGGAPQPSKTRFACFKCRKAFKSTRNWGYIKKCPNCGTGDQFYPMSVYWYPPKQSDIKGWEWSKKFANFNTGIENNSQPEKEYEFLPNYKKPNKKIVTKEDRREY